MRYNKSSLPIEIVLIGAFLLMLSGCVGQASAPTRFYMLSPISGPELNVKMAEGDQSITVGVGPIELPAYLDRPQLVIRESENEFKLAEFDQWAEPLQSNFTRVFVVNLNKLLNEKNVAIIQWRISLPLDYQIQLSVIRLESDLKGNAVLDVGWMILGDDGKKMLIAKTSSYSESADSQDYKDIVAAQSRAIAAFSKEIADIIKKLTR